MSLATLGLNLIREGFALAIDCACCIGELCDGIPCVSNRECQEAELVPDATCQCKRLQCTSECCQSDEDCPEGYYCLDCACVPKCTGEPCTEDFDCNDGCVCAGGQCFPASDMVYCQRNPDDLDAEPRCRFGRPADPSLIVAGPFTSYGICCFVGCDCKYICNPVSLACNPNPDGEYSSQSECEGACGDPDDMGRCCQSVVDYDDDGKAISYETGPADVCPSTREWCKSDPPVEMPGQRTFRSFNPLFDNCDLCPVNAQGPCCLDGECKMGLDRLECEDAGGEFKGDSWIDCETPRDPAVGQFFDYACPGCNGQGDCACEDNEFCDGMACSECGDNLFDVTPGQTTFTNIELSGPSNLYVYIRDCKFGERIDGDREVSVYVGDQLAGKVACRDKTNECTNGGVIETNLEGKIELREASTDITVCITVEDACGDPCGTIPAMGAIGACCGVKPFVLVTQEDLNEHFADVLCDPEFPNDSPAGPGAWFDLYSWLLSLGWSEAFAVKKRIAGNGCNIEIWGVPGGPCDNFAPFPCISENQSGPYPGTDFTTSLPGCCPEPVSSCVDEVGGGIKVDEWQCSELRGKFVEGGVCENNPCPSVDACCVTPYRLSGGNDSATETDFPNAEAAVSFCEELNYPNPLSDCYAVPGSEGGWLWRQAFPLAEPFCVPGCEDCSPPIFDENTPLEGFYKECVAGKTCDDNPCRNAAGRNPLP